MREVKKMTLVYPVTDADVLLGKKKRGFGEGKWNGFGGKVGSDERVIETALRELREEAGIVVSKDALEQVAHLLFEYKKITHDVDVFFIQTWDGEPEETEEMQPGWFKRNALPFEEMWDDDRHWMPIVLEGRRIKAKYWFDRDGETVTKIDIEDLY